MDNARCRFRTASCSPSPFRYTPAFFFVQIHPTRLYGFGHSFVSVDCHWCPMATTTVAREHEYSSAFRKEGSRGCERVRGVKGAMAKGWRGRILTKERWWGLKERESKIGRRERLITDMQWSFAFSQCLPRTPGRGDKRGDANYTASAPPRF